jgi:hypothetical protein
MPFTSLVYQHLYSLTFCNDGSSLPIATAVELYESGRPFLVFQDKISNVNGDPELFIRPL